MTFGLLMAPECLPSFSAVGGTYNTLTLLTIYSKRNPVFIRVALSLNWM